MTPQHSAPGSNQQSHNHKRAHAASNRVAIPLPLSKPRASKQTTQPTKNNVLSDQPQKKELDMRDNARDSLAAEVLRGKDEAAPPTTNGVTNGASPETDAESKTPMPVAAALSERSNGSLANGTTANHSQQGSLNSSSPAEPVDAGASRKPSNIRTELPPAFVPSAGHRTPHSASSSRPLSQDAPPFQPQGHASRPSTASLVFGEVESSGSSSVPPQSAGSTFVPPPPQSMQRPHQVPPFNPAHHAHRFSESQVYPIYPPGYAPQQPWSHQRAFYPAPHPQPPFPPQAQPQYRFPPQEPFMPTDPTQPVMPSALSRSTSPASAYAEAARAGQEIQTGATLDKAGVAKPFQESNPAFSTQLPLRQPQFANQMPPQPGPIPPPDFRLDMDNAQTLRNHVRAQFAKPSFADCRLQISHDLDASTQRIDAHKLILARSPTLSRLIQGATGASGSTMQLDVHLPGKYMSLHAFNECLKYIYGGQLPPLDPPYRQSFSFVEPTAAQLERMERALQRIATGTWLEMQAITSRGMDVAINAMSWDTFPIALEFGLEGGICPMWTLDDGSEERGSTTSSDDSSSRSDSTPSAPTYDPFATQLLKVVLQFVLNGFPTDFYPDTNAPQLAVYPRLPPLPPPQPQRQEPQHEKNKLSRSADPRLSQIRFGELPSEEDTPPRPSPLSTRISSLLFSLPFSLLKFLLEHPLLAERIGAETVGSIMRQTVVERESRRLRCLKAKEPGEGTSRNKQDEVAELYWEESVEATGQSRLGLRLCRKKKGVETPPSSNEGTVNA